MSTWITLEFREASGTSLCKVLRHSMETTWGRRRGRKRDEIVRPDWVDSSSPSLCFLPPSFSFLAFVLVPFFVRLGTSAVYIFNASHIVQESSAFSTCVQDERCGLASSLASNGRFRWIYLAFTILSLLTVSFPFLAIF